MNVKSKAAKAKTAKTASRTLAPANSEKTLVPAGYDAVRIGIVELLQAARVQAARSVNALMTASYWEIGRRIVEAEQQGKRRAGYGEQLIARLSADLSSEFGRGFSADNLENMRRFYLAYSSSAISETASRKSSQDAPPSISETPSRILTLAELGRRFTLPWSAYVRLLSVKNEQARRFYETETLRGGWSVRQLDRQVNSQFYERTALSRNKSTMLTKGAAALPEDAVTPDQAVKDPYVLEFLNLKDEYSEADLEEGLIHRLEDFLLELGDDFAFIGRQRRLRLDDTWFRVDLVFFHRRLRCLVVVDLKVGKFNYADAGQMHMYLNYAKANWMREGENPPVGLILCSQKGNTEAHYSLEGLSNKVLAAEYQMVLPSEAVIAKELAHATRLLKARTISKSVYSKKITKRRGNKRG